MSANPKAKRAKLDADEHCDARSGLKLGYLADSVGYQIRRAHNGMVRDYEAQLADVGIPPRYLGLLLLIELNPGAAQSRIAEAAGLDRSTLVPVIDRLQDAGFLERRPSPDDARSNGLWLTRKGSKVAARMKKLAIEREAKMLAGISAAERKLLVDLLGRVGGNFERSESEH